MSKAKGFPKTLKFWGNFIVFLSKLVEFSQVLENFLSFCKKKKWILNIQNIGFKQKQSLSFGISNEKHYWKYWNSYVKTVD